MQALQRLGLKGTLFTNAQCSTSQVKLLKIAARVDVSVRRVWFSWSENYPWQRQFSRVVDNLKQVQVHAPPVLTPASPSITMMADGLDRPPGRDAAARCDRSWIRGLNR